MKNKSVWMRPLVSVLLLLAAAGLPAQNATDFFLRGKAAQDAGDWYTAVEQYQESVRRNPAFFDAQFSLAQCFYELEEYDRAFAYAQEAEKLRTNSQDVQTLKGFVLIGLGRLAEAEAVFSSVLRTSPNNINARFGLGELDIAAGRISAAENQYTQALHRSPENRRALLSLALICQEEGKNEAAAGFIEQALKYYGDNAQTLYIAGVFEMNRRNYGLAERYLRGALTINPAYDDARSVLVTALYYSGRFQEMNDEADRLIQRDRSRTVSWYQKALALSRLGRIDEAVATARSGLNAGADDEIVRIFAEELVLRNFPLEDARRTEWAAARFVNAASYAKHNMSARAVFEYRRGLKLNPYDTDARLAYASLLLAGGYPSRYLEEMTFIRSLGDTSTAVSDAIENYGALLRDSVPARWEIDSLYVDKGHISGGIYFLASSDNLLHPGAEQVAAEALADTLSFYRRFSVRVENSPVESYAEAFRVSRERGEDFFAMISMDENKTDVGVNLDIYLSRTGSPAADFSVFRTGNGRFSSALRSLADNTAAAFPVYGSVLKRERNNLVIDLGRADGVAVDATFTVVPEESLSLNPDGLGLSFPERAVLGTVRITAVDSDVSEGTFARHGFFDRMNPGDAVILQPAEEETGDGDAAASADGGRTPQGGLRENGLEPQVQETGSFPSLFSILRGIR